VLSVRAQILELVGDDREPRPTVAEVAAALPAGSVAPARLDDLDVAVVRLVDGRLCVVPDQCPHDGGRISDGWVDGDRLVCARHGWEIDPCNRPCPLRL
jgi:phenylpropionate dioxygenase-like ring-hydroxylating dioxygenase large terminal subunit